MLQGDDGQILPDHGHDLAGAISGGIDHDLRLDLAFVGGDAPVAIGLLRESRHPGEALDAAAEILGALGIGLGQLAGIDIAVIGIPERALEIMQLEEGMARLASAGVSSSNSMPWAWAMEATCLYSSIRSRVWARRSEPVM